MHGSRTITISFENSLGCLSDALNDAINRFNSEALSINFQRVNTPQILVTQVSNVSYLASAGFPSAGKPYKSILVNLSSVNRQPEQTIATILAHEMGHCIGFRHTDYYNRSSSCEGSLQIQETIGNECSILIPGTP